MEDDLVATIISKKLREMLKLLASDETIEGKAAYALLMDIFKLTDTSTIDLDV